MSQMSWDNLNSYKKAVINDEAVAIVWSIHDVLALAEDNELVLSVDEAIEVLQRCYHGHDAGYGFTWGLISHHLYEFIEQREHADLVFPPEYDHECN